MQVLELIHSISDSGRFYLGNLTFSKFYLNWRWIDGIMKEGILYLTKIAAFCKTGVHTQHICGTRFPSLYEIFSFYKSKIAF